MSPEQWRQYLAERNRQEGKGLSFLGTTLMAYAFLCAVFTDITSVVLFPWQGICAITVAGSIYEMFFCFRALFEGESMQKYSMKISAVFIMVGIGVIVAIRQMDIDMPVMIMYPVLIVIGYCLRKSGKERLDEKWPK